MLVKRLTKELERINKKIERLTIKTTKIEDRLDKSFNKLLDKKQEIKSLIDIEEMKERNKHGYSK